MSEEASLLSRFAKAALSLHEGRAEFEIAIPEGYDEVGVAAAFRAQGCEITYLTPRRTVIVAPRRIRTTSVSD